MSEVPKFYPDNETIRRDLADYAVESEWFDVHLGRIVRTLEEAGELGNTLILATSDHRMPFPRVKGQIYEHGFHLPLAVRWGGKRQGRTIEDFINVRDFAPTMLQLAGVEAPDSMTGRSFVDILESDRSGWVDRNRNRDADRQRASRSGAPQRLGLSRPRDPHTRVPVLAKFRAGPMACRQPRNRLSQLRPQPH